ncbi:Isa2p ASCRUDRAFT_25619, partial [Ascoidea rubescens DSM 1968]
IINPIHDDSNKLLKVGITQLASKKLNEIMIADNSPNLALKINVESGGCHGFQYILSLSDVNGDNMELVDTENSIFLRDGAKVIIDKSSLEILKESTIDYVHELIGSQFKVVDSPYTTSSCGCGSSFDVDFEKLS